MLKFDLCFSNPPYGLHDNIDLKIIQDIMRICSELIIVHPLSWLFDIKQTKPIFKSFRNSLQNNIKSIYEFNGNKVFNITKSSSCGIVHIDENYKSSIISLTNIKKQTQRYYNITDITIHYENWKTIASPFYDEIKKISDKDNLWDHILKPGRDGNFKMIKGKYYYQLPICGVTGISEETRMVGDNFYVFFLQNITDRKFEVTNSCHLLRIKNNNRIYASYEFSNDIYRDNLINYLKSFLPRFCLTFSKNGANISNNSTLSIVPWLDFTQSWDDQKLMNYFKIGPKTQEYIYNFLPDYYGIGKPAIVYPVNPVTI